MQTAYEQVVHWRSNLFHLPKGITASKFVLELSQLFNIFPSGSRGGDIALMSVMLLPSLVLQRPYKRSKPKDHIACLEHRLPLWGTADGVHQLIKEGKSIQHHLPHTRHDPRRDGYTTKFADIMTRGKVKDAIYCLSQSRSGGVLSLSDVVTEGSNAGRTVLDVLKDNTLLVNPLFLILYYPTNLVTMTLLIFFMNWMVRPLDVQHSGLKVLLVHQVPMP